jgi:hypothetical protein
VGGEEVKGGAEIGDIRDRVGKNLKNEKGRREEK